MEKPTDSTEIATNQDQIRPGYVGNLTESQQKLLDVLKHHVEVEKSVKNRRFDDAYYLRFCRACKFDQTKTLEFFDKFLIYREKYSVDTICDNDFSWFSQLQEIIPCGYYGLAKGGFPLYIETYKKFNTKKLLKIATKEQILLQNIVTYERLLHIIFPKATEVAGRKIDRMVGIIDMKGIGMTTMMSGEARSLITMAITVA